MDVDANAELRAAGLRITPGRVAALEALANTPHSDAQSLRLTLAASLPGISIQSVHNVLADLTVARLVRRIEPAGSAALYERRVGDNHHHVVCTVCETVADVDCLHGSAPCLTPGNTAGFVIDTAEITFWGLCPRCQESTTNNRENNS
jgi:Fur family ferric uptake transcriptional regulator